MLAGIALVVAPGCDLIIPDVGHQPMVYNPFPQLSRVAVAPFFNQSDEATVDGRKFALAYFSELQATPGFEVVPLGVVEEAILEHQVDLSHAGEARRLARILGVDVVVIGSVTDYTPYYPPRCGLRVEWYAVNPGFHEIPPGYGLPWGTPEAEFIPEPLVFEAEMALAKAQLSTQTPACELPPIERPAPRAPPVAPPSPLIMPPAPESGKHGEEKKPTDGEAGTDAPQAPAEDQGDSESSDATSASFNEQLAEEDLPPASSADASLPLMQPESPVATDTTAAIGAANGRRGDPPNWPDEGSFIPQPPCATRPPCVPNDGPVMTHTRIYHGHEGDFTEALANYYHFRNDARFGGWQNYLQRSDDFIRFCCHVHIAEMLSARGGAGKTRVVWRWPDSR
ncbi:MAG: hypothetical protein WD738_10520 [Pirellulales bacterium]